MRGFTQFKNDPGRLQRWKEDIFFIMRHKDLDYFQLKFSYGTPIKVVALQYSIKSDGSIQSDTDSGGINYYQFPINTQVSISVMRHGSDEVSDYLRSRNWGTNATFVSGNSESAGSYSKEGYGTNREKFGEWEQ